MESISESHIPLDSSSSVPGNRRRSRRHTVFSQCCPLTLQSEPSAVGINLREFSNTHCAVTPSILSGHQTSQGNKSLLPCHSSEKTTAASSLVPQSHTPSGTLKMKLRLKEFTNVEKVCRLNRSSSKEFQKGGTCPLLKSCGCEKLKCGEKLSENWQRQLHDRFWSLNSFDIRKQWLLKYTVCLKNKCLSLHTKYNSDRKWVLKDSTGKMIRVCRRFFLRTLSYNWNSVLYLMLKDTHLTSRNVNSTHQDVKHLGSRTKDSLRWLIFMHIKSFLKKHHAPMKNSKGSLKHVFDYSLVKKSFHCFKATHPYQTTSYRLFRKIFYAVFGVFSIDNTFMSIMPNVNLLCQAYQKFDLPAVTLEDPSFELDKSLKGIKTGTLSAFKINRRNNVRTKAKNSYRGRGDEVKEDKVIMQLDVDNDAVFITQNCSDSDTEDEGEETGKIEKNNTVKFASYEEKTQSSKKTSLKVEYIREEHQMLSPCTCKRRCFSKLTESRRKEIYSSFWNLDDYWEKKHWIMKHIQKSDLKRRTRRRKQKTRHYFLTDENDHPILVCPVYFQRTLGLTDGTWLETLCDSIPKDIWLPHTRQVNQKEQVKKITVKVRKCVEQYIKNHILMDNSNKNIDNLRSGTSSAGLSVKKMHSNFLAAQSDFSISYELFRKIFYAVHKVLLQSAGTVCEENMSDASGLIRHSLRSRLSRMSCKSMLADSEKYDSGVPERRRSTRTTRMQGSMAEDNLLELGGESRIRKSKMLATSEPFFSQHENLSAHGDNQKIKPQSSTSDQPLATTKLYSSNRDTNKTRQKKRIKQRRHEIYDVRKKQKNKRNVKKSEDLLLSSQKSCLEAVHNSKRHRQLTVWKNKHKHPILPPCNCSRRKCIENIPEKTRMEIHEHFWNLSNGERKRWLMKYVEKRERKIKVLSLFPQRKNESIKYYFLPDGQDQTIEVCRLFFIHTLGFRWDSVVDAIIKTKTPSHFGTEKSYQFKKPLRQLPEYIVDSVKQYLKSIQHSQNSSNDVETVTDKQGEDSKGNNSLKVKDLFKNWKMKYKSLKFNLGYHSFRRIFQSVVDPIVDTSGRVTPKENENYTSDVVDDVDDKIATLLPVSEVSYPGVMKTSNTSEVKSSINLNTISFLESPETSNIFSASPNEPKIMTAYSKSVLQNDKDSCLTNVDLHCSEQNTSLAKDADDRILDVGSGYFKHVGSSGGSDIHRLYTYDYTHKKRRSLSVRNDRSNYPVLSPCKCSKRKCAEKFSEAQRQKINDIFWNLGNYNERKQWILEHIKRADIKRRVVFSEGVPRKLESRWYYMPDDEGNKIDVCKSFFLRTLGYRWDSVIDTIGKTTPKGEKLVVPDKRGRKPPPHKISDEAVSSMTLYIENVCHMYQPFYQQKSQNNKKGSKTSMGSLNPYGLTMKQLFEDYRSKHSNHKFGYESFRKVFRRVHSAFLASLPPDESIEEPEVAYSEMDASVEKGYSKPAEVECSSGLQPNPITESYQDVSHYTSPPPPPAPLSSHHEVSHPKQVGNGAPERRSCLYQYSDHSCESQQLQPLPTMQVPDTAGPAASQDHYSSMDHDPFMKYSHNLYCQPTCVPGHFSQVVDHLGYSNNVNLQTDIDPATCGGQGQFPPYFMPNPEPLRCQVYQMASQYKSILHHIAESNRYFNYGNFSSPDATCQGGHEKQYPYMKHQDFHRDNINAYNIHKHQDFHRGNINSYNIPKTSNNYVSESSMSTQYPLGHIPHINAQQVSTNMILSPYSNANDNSFSPERISTMKDQDVDNRCDNGLSSETKGGKSATRGRVEPKKAKSDKSKIKKEKKMKPKSVRNYGDHYPILSPCHCKKKKCTDKFSENDRQRIHDMFWDLKDYNERKQWMLLHIKREDCKRRRIDQFESFRKQESRWYFFPDEDGNQQEVCKDFFLRTLGYKWDSVIDTIRRTTPKGETNTRPDQRGRKAPSHKLSKVVLRSVVQYIESMQQVSQLPNTSCVVGSGQFGKPENPNSDQSSQDTGSNSGGQIAIPYGLTMKDLYDDYKAKHAGHKIGYESFRRIFRALSRSEKIAFDNRSTDDEILNPDNQDLVDF